MKEYFGILGLIGTVIVVGVILYGQISGLRTEMKADMRSMVSEIRVDVREIRKSVAEVSNGVADNRSRLALVAFASKHGITDKLPPHIVSGTSKPAGTSQKSVK